MALNGLRICWDIKVKDEKRLRCDEEVGDPRTTEEVMKLINEFLNRVEKHKAILLSNLITPFDHTISALNEWLKKIETNIEAGNDRSVAELRKTMYELSMGIRELAQQVREAWLSKYRSELEELIVKLMKGEVTVLIKGDALNKNKSFIVNLRARHLSVAIERVAVSGSITITLRLIGRKGIYIVAPRLLSNNLLKPAEYGLLLTDGTIDKDGYPKMNTNHLWQIIVFSLAYPGKVRLAIDGVNLNNGDVKVKWELRAISHKTKFKSKAKITKKVLKLNYDEFLTFLLFAVLGDGNIYIKRKKKVIDITIGGSKHELWKGIIEMMESLGFKNYGSRNTKRYELRSSKAVALAKEWLNNALVKVIVECLSQLPDADKLRNLITLASMRVKPHGRSMIEIIDDVWMNINVRDAGYVELRAWRRRLEDARAIQEALRRAGYEAKLREARGGFEIYINKGQAKRSPELLIKICGALRKMYEDAISENNERKAEKIARAIITLNCPVPCSESTRLKILPL
ncbi:hypothetical protein [Vulcanisaeta distributa]|uniref:Uncharacterized protein n=1 Tax=Vulcanisaeta distributa (strain DSM 14429 / JCM 11212 / NBRC 100878 / IC-017) TaxID=572478 RepID=E1QSB5_VULDI|nr:hypothetical protein [Vulcanisaeta distributa]ADN49508.1 hypothetical protein Vdis_0094 [Vulcanisaeta distributa DSM 14429]